MRPRTIIGQFFRPFAFETFGLDVENSLETPIWRAGIFTPARLRTRHRHARGDQVARLDLARQDDQPVGPARQRYVCLGSGTRGDPDATVVAAGSYQPQYQMYPGPGRRTGAEAKNRRRIDRPYAPNFRSSPAGYADQICRKFAIQSVQYHRPSVAADRQISVW